MKRTTIYFLFVFLCVAVNVAIVSVLTKGFPDHTTLSVGPLRTALGFAVLILSVATVALLLNRHRVADWENKRLLRMKKKAGFKHIEHCSLAPARPGQTLLLHDGNGHPYGPHGSCSACDEVILKNLFEVRSLPCPKCDMGRATLTDDGSYKCPTCDHYFSYTPSPT